MYVSLYDYIHTYYIDKERREDQRSSIISLNYVFLLLNMKSILDENAINRTECDIIR